jgi:uncharacterized protein (UPF0332 family)
LKEETADYFKRARKKLDDAEKLLSLGFYEDAGRDCYLAGMNAARGLLFEDSFRVTKRHKELYGALSEVLHLRGIHNATLTAFLPNMAQLKAIADYETGDNSITKERAAEALKAAKHFVDTIGKIAQTPAKHEGSA